MSIVLGSLPLPNVKKQNYKEKQEAGFKEQYLWNFTSGKYYSNKSSRGEFETAYFNHTVQVTASVF